MERTYVMVKPDGVQRGLIGEIVKRIERRGLKVTAMRMNTIEREKAEEHYAEHKEKPFFQDLIDFMTSGPSISMVVEGENAIRIMRAINGATNPVEAAPGTIRGDLAIDTGRNVVHGADSKESAEREIKIHFTDDEITEYTRADEEWVYE
ncbi:nucleoside-diphosphate kinase [Methanosarcinales archaeon]|nr:MAG: nucleoside-diphosphate kinase [Methanosarcinales archaeon]HHI30406.1 nucleoside-diphosphate kinase [Candidatus Methanoperedenaceae archaeon]